MSISVQALPDKKENDVPEQPDKSGGQIRTNPDTYSCKSNPVRANVFINHTNQAAPYCVRKLQHRDHFGNLETNTFEPLAVAVHVQQHQLINDQSSVCSIFL